MMSNNRQQAMLLQSKEDTDILLLDNVLNLFVSDNLALEHGLERKYLLRLLVLHQIDPAKCASS